MSRADRPSPGERGVTSTRNLRERVAIAGFLILLVAFIGLVLIPGYRLANRVAADSAALKVVSEHRREAESIANSLVVIRDRLGSRVYIGRGVKDLGASMQGFDRAVAKLKYSAVGNTPELLQLESLWADYRKALDPVAGFEGLPYSDSDAAGAQLNSLGRKLLNDTRQAIQTGRGVTAPLTAALSSVSSSLEKRVVMASASLRTLMIAGVVFACLLVPLLAYFQWLKARHERMAAEAQNQVRDILGTVKDGLFLIDADFRIGKAHSTALSRLFRRDDFSDTTLDELLRDIVTEQTLATATKYVKLLWGQRANENLIRSINPLAEVEVHFDRGDGGRDLRYLEFDFHRVKREEGVRQILVSVNDVTSRVLLARELKESQAHAHGQMDMLLGLLQVDPTQLASFLDDTGAALAHVNNVLKVPARDDADFRAKIDQLFREMHRIKGEAATLGLASVEGRAHSFEDRLKELRDRPQLSGNDFLPLVVSLDDMLGHLQSIRGLVNRADSLRDNALLSAGPPPQAVPSSSGAGLQDLAVSLDTLAQRIAADLGKKVRLDARGLNEVPDELRKAVRDIAIQLARNAVVHGIEDAAARLGSEKSETGVLQVVFRPNEQGFELMFQDDGQGIVAEKLREAAIRRGDVSPQEAARIDSKAVLGLIFRPGFSTHATSSRDAGRGVGLDFVLKAVQSLGGRISVATAPGKYTRFSISLPAQRRQAGAVA